MIAKIFLPILLVMFIIPSSFAQSVGGGGSGGGGLKIRATKSRCVEGSRRIFYERDYSQDHTVTVIRTCQNGSYYDLTDYVYNPKNRCTEGRRELWRERDHINDQSVDVRVICIKGQWRPVVN